jgi:hypothetical protein
MVNFSYWVQEALLDYCTLLLDIRTKALHEKKKRKKNPAVHVTRLMNDLMAVFSATAVAKVQAYRDKRLEQDAAGFERALVFVRPSTSGGNRAELARSDLESDGLLPRAKTPLGARVVTPSVGPTGENNGHQRGGRIEETASKSVTLPSIDQQRAETRSRQRRGRSPGKDTQQEREPSQQEVLTQCFAVVAAMLARLILQKERSPAAFCSVRPCIAGGALCEQYEFTVERCHPDRLQNFRRAIAAQEKEEAEAVSDRVLITSEEQLYYKRVATQAGYLASYMKQLRNKVIEFSDLIDLMDRGWVKFVVHLVCCALMNHYHKYEPSRRKGENYAADRLIAFFRGIVVRNIVARVWQRTKLLMAATMSPSLSSKGTSVKNSPATLRGKRLGGTLATRSGDSRDARKSPDTMDGSKHSLPSPGQSVAPTVKPKRRDTGERRKPLCFRNVATPTAQSLVIDLSVGIEDDAFEPATATVKELARLSERYEDWRKVRCVAYVETLTDSVPHQLTAKQVLGDSHMFVAGGLPPTGGSAQSKPHRVEQPIKRRLVIRLFSHTNRKLFDLEEPSRISIAEESRADSKVRKMPVKVTIDVSDGVPTDAVTQQPDFLQSFHGGTQSMRARAQGNAEEAWDDRSIESQSVISGKKPSSSFPLKASAPKHVSHTVISYRINVADIPSFSCYNVQLEFDSTLAADLREGNTTYFRYLSLVDENDEISVDSDDSLKHVRFTEVGRQWAIAVEETIEVHSDDSASIEAFPELEVMKVELEQYTYTRPGVPRTVKDLTARVAYSSADLLAVTRQDSHSPAVAQTRHHAPAVLYAAVYQPDTALPGLPGVDQAHDNSRNPAAHFVASHEMSDHMQGCVLLHWRHSVEDNHGNTHYEAQRRLLLTSSAPPAKVRPSDVSSAVVNRPHPRDFNHRYRESDAEKEAAPVSSEEMVYVGPWKHVAGLKGVVSDTKKASSAKKPSTANKSSLQPLWSFPLHANSCTDKVSLPEELNTNPDAYNCVMGYLCACFPDLVLQAASQIAESAVASEEASLASGVSSRLLQQDPQQPPAKQTPLEGEALNRTVPSALRIAYEYRLRAINSAGTGKFNSTSATAPLQYMLRDGRKPVKMCVVPVALVCAQLSALREFRVNHPKYRSHNVALVTTVLHQRAEALRVDSESFLVEPSGDEFVQQLVAIKDASTGEAAHVAKEEAQLHQGDEDAEIGAWLKSLERECPIRLK